MKFNVKIEDKDGERYAGIRFIAKENSKKKIFYYAERRTRYINEDNSKDIIETWKYIELTESKLYNQKDTKIFAEAMMNTAEDLLNWFGIEYSKFSLIKTE